MQTNQNITFIDMKNIVVHSNKSFIENEKKRDQMQDTLEKMLSVAANKKFLSDEFAKKLKSEIDSLEKQIQVDSINSPIEIFAQVAHYVWTHPEKETMLIVESKKQCSSSDQELAYSFSGPFGNLLEEATIPFNQFGLVWFIDYKNNKQKLNSNSSWKDFSDFFVNNFCDEPSIFAEAFKKYN